MKRIFLIMILICCNLFLFAQTETPEEEEEVQVGGFKPELLFTGGNINIGYFSGVTVLGATPQLGYSITKWLDAGIVFGYTYTNENVEYETRYQQSLIGPGAFVRLFPIDFIFATAQFEHNFIIQNITYPGGSESYRTDVNSLLVGLGYTSGRAGRNSPYYYFSVSFDVLDNLGSPYRDYMNQPYPVVNAGFNIPLFQGIKRKTSGDD